MWQVPCLQAGRNCGMRARAVLRGRRQGRMRHRGGDKTDGDGLVVLNELIEDEAHATRLLAEEYGGPAGHLGRSHVRAFDK